MGPSGTELAVPVFADSADVTMNPSPARKKLSRLERRLLQLGDGGDSRACLFCLGVETGSLHGGSGSGLSTYGATPRVSAKSNQQQCPTRVSHKSAPQECFTRLYHKCVSYKSVPQERPTRVSYKSVSRDCTTSVSPIRVSHMSVPQESALQECPTRVSHKSVPQKSPTRVPRKSVSCKSACKSFTQECRMRVSAKVFHK